MAIEGRPDLVLFAGPVETSRLRNVQFEHPTEVVMVRGPTTAAGFRELAKVGLEELVPRLTGKTLDSYRKVAISAYSKGGSFTDELLRDPQTRSRINAVVLNDAVFGSLHEGLMSFVPLAADRGKLMIITNTNNKASENLPKRARESVEDLLGNQTTRMDNVEAKAPMPDPVGGVWKAGNLFWYDYVHPQTGQNQLTHAQHHDLADETWQAHLVPFFTGLKFNVFLVAAALTTVLAATVWLGRTKS